MNEGSNPSPETRPEDGTMIARTRVDDMGQRRTEFDGREFFIKSMSRPGQRVLRVCNPKTGDVL